MQNNNTQALLTDILDILSKIRERNNIESNNINLQLNDISYILSKIRETKSSQNEDFTGPTGFSNILITDNAGTIDNSGNYIIDVSDNIKLSLVKSKDKPETYLFETQK